MALSEKQREYAREYQRRRRRDPEARAKDSEYGRAYRARNREKLAAESRAYYHAVTKLRPKDTTAVRERMLRSKYGISLEEYNTLLAHQGGGCAICGVTASRRKTDAALPVDHDHGTGRVRGILCDECNIILGLAEDDAPRLERAAAYLKGVIEG